VGAQFCHLLPEKVEGLAQGCYRLLLGCESFRVALKLVAVTLDAGRDIIPQSSKLPGLRVEVATQIDAAGGAVIVDLPLQLGEGGHLADARGRRERLERHDICGG
jgi:hypothetical protein